MRLLHKHHSGSVYITRNCYVRCGCSYQLRSRAIGWQSLVAAFAQRRELGLPSLLAGSHKLATCTCVAGKVYFTYLSPLGKKPRTQYHRWFYNQGLKLCYRCSFRGEWERTCVVEPSDDGSKNDDSITQQNQRRMNVASFAACGEPFSPVQKTHLFAPKRASQERVCLTRAYDCHVFMRPQCQNTTNCWDLGGWVRLTIGYDLHRDEYGGI